MWRCTDIGNPAEDRSMQDSIVFGGVVGKESRGHAWQ